MSNVINDAGTQAGDTLDCLLLNPSDDFSRYPYLGLCLLAAVLRERGIRVEILDSAALGYSMPDVIEHIKKRKPRIIGITTMSMMLHFCYQLIQGIKESYPEGIIVVGGAHIDADVDILAPMNVRYGFRGECEYAFADFCEQLLGGQTPGPMPGLIINDHGNVYAGEPNVVADLDSLPMLAYDLLPLEKYYSPSTNLKTISFISSRGCPYNCLFCSKLQRVRYRHLSTDNFLDQLEVLVREHGMQWIEFVDEIFTLNRNRVVELCQAIIQRNLVFQWGIGTRPDRIDEELIRLMKEAGCRKIGFGIETGVERVRFAVNKKITNQQIVDAVNCCRKHGMKIMGSFIFGHPTETKEEMLQTISFAKRLGLTLAYFHKMIPIPNSELFETAKREGVLEKDVWTDFMLGKRSHPLYTPKGVSPDAVHRIYRRAWFAMYFWPPNIWRNRSVLLQPRHFLQSAKAFFKLSSVKRYQK